MKQANASFQKSFLLMRNSLSAATMNLRKMRNIFFQSRMGTRISGCSLRLK
ncbi:hypothetical protein CsSME_00049731 [Camellia sinensis var. sinensis]